MELCDILSDLESIPEQTVTSISSEDNDEENNNNTVHFNKRLFY